MRIWLDDVRDPKEPFIQREYGAVGDEVWVKTGHEVYQLIQQGKVTSISIDNDLGPGYAGTATGYDIACLIEKLAHDNLIGRMQWSIHTDNGYARLQIHQAMTNADKYWTEHELKRTQRVSS